MTSSRLHWLVSHSESSVVCSSMFFCRHPISFQRTPPVTFTLGPPLSTLIRILLRVSYFLVNIFNYTYPSAYPPRREAEFRLLAWSSSIAIIVSMIKWINNLPPAGENASFKKRRFASRGISAASRPEVLRTCVSSGVIHHDEYSFKID